MPLPTQLGHGGAGLHGDNAGVVRTGLNALATLANEIKTDRNALLTKLDADVLVADTDYAAAHATAAANVSGTASLGSGGTGLNGDAAIRLARRVRLLAALATEITLDHNAVLVKMDADAGIVANTLGPQNEVQTITISATGGVWQAVRGGATSTPIAWNATAATLQAALEAMNTVATDEIVVTGGPGASAPYTLTHSGHQSAATDVAQLTTVATGLTGGGSTAIVATTITGRAGTGTITAPNAGNLWPTAFGAGGQGVAGDRGWGTSLRALAVSLNEAKVRHNALLAVLDADAGVTDTDYVATLTVAAPSI